MPLEVFQKEVGPGLIHAHGHLGDPLFSEDGITEYAKDALQRMVNPFLNDPIERVTRDPMRKLGWEDRLIGAMRLCLDAEIKPIHLAEGIKVALARAVVRRIVCLIDSSTRSGPPRLTGKKKMKSFPCWFPDSFPGLS